MKNHTYIIADHMRASCMLIADGVKPSGKQQGYVLRRLLRRSLSSSLALGIDITNEQYFVDLVNSVIGIYSGVYDEVEASKELIISICLGESQKYQKALQTGEKEWGKIFTKIPENGFDGELLAQKMFDLYQTHGVPLELSEDLLEKAGQKFDALKLSELIDNHQNLSQSASIGQFKSGLGETNEITTRLHTATHLLHTVLREMYGTSVKQMGSAITSEKARFDFTKDERLNDDEIQKIVKTVQQRIEKCLQVQKQEMSETEARKTGAIGLFGEKYGEKVTVYSVHDDAGKVFSREFCGGPHVTNTSEIGKFSIIKQKSIGQGLKRLEFTVS
jgi:alanyl-tRNA synthetase